MNKAAGHSFHVQSSLQEYYDACADSEGSEEEFDSENYQELQNDRRSSWHSLQREKARLNLRLHSSGQHELRDYRSSNCRGPNAATAATLFAGPLGASVLIQDNNTGNIEGPVDSVVQSGAWKDFIFDALCALCQAPNRNFEILYSVRGGGPPVWSLRKGLASTETWENVPYCLRTLVEAILIGANDVARAQWLLQALSLSISRDDIGVMEDAFVDYSQTSTGEEGLSLAARLVLCRFKSVVGRVVHKVLSWALQLQEKQQMFSTASDILRANLYHSVERSLLPLRRCIHLLEHICRLTDDSQLMDTSSTTKGKEVDTINLASSLMDYFIVRMSALQDSNTMDLYRFYMVLLLYCGWPYVLLMTSAIFGFVKEIDADAWRANLPRIFRLSFSHIRSENSGKSYRKTCCLPTDILSLVLLCIDYEKVETSSLGNDDENQRPGENRARRRAAFVAMLSARSFILRSFVAFARQKVLVAWSRKSPADHRASQSETMGRDESWRTTLSKWKLWRFSNGDRELKRCRITDALSLALCNDSESGFLPSQSECFFWSLQVEDGKTHHDLLLVDHKEQGDTNRLQLWLHTELPAARWVTAGLLVPIGQIVQHLHARQLAMLLSPAVARHRVEYFYEKNDDDDDCDNNQLLDVDYGMDVAAMNRDNASVFSSRRRASQMLLGSSIAVPTSVQYGVTFQDAVKLIVDIVLCRDSERIVYTFLYRLLLEPHWWYRRDEAEYKYSGTASSFISTTFADAICGKTFGQFVRLSVAPKCNFTVQQDAGNDYALEMLRTFASFKLIFSLPWDIELILFPSTLSVAWGKGGDIEEKYSSYFWKNRRRREEAVEMGTKDDGEGTQQPQCVDERRVKVQDTWSYCFGYLCSLYYAQISLREQRKRLQRRDVDTYYIMSTLGTTREGQKHTVRVSRGLGSAYFELSFAVDSLLSFTQNVVSIVARELEGELTTKGVVISCIALCQRIDALLLRLGCVCFPATQRQQLTDANSVSAADPIRECVTSVLTIALDPANMPLRHITSRTQSAIEALVAVVRALPPTSVLKERMKPLLVLLTFNRFYGE